MHFYSNTKINNKIILDKEEMHHCINVLRKKNGDFIKVVDGQGGAYVCEIISIESDNCEIKIIEQLETLINRKNKIHLIIAPTKSHKRLEWMIEKVVEIGLEKISFIITHNTIRKKINLLRLQKIALSAMKQNLNTILPTIEDCKPYAEVIDSVESQDRYIAHLQNSSRSYLVDKLITNRSRCILIGPEGDFTDDEINYANKSNFQCVSLGSLRLRTETSAMVSTTLLNIGND